MVKALHRAGIEVILDVVFNHTGEGERIGTDDQLPRASTTTPTIYSIRPTRRYYLDYSGCGNTVNCNHPIAQKLILDCLHVLGAARCTSTAFASTRARCWRAARTARRWSIRRSSGRSSSPTTLADTKVIAEAWDAAGLYQVGYLSRVPLGGVERPLPRRRPALRARRSRHGGRWSPRGSRAAPTSTRPAGHLPINSVNFVTCHDGFTLNDLVSYNDKHNEANGEGNRDGMQRQPELELRRRRARRTTPRIDALRSRQIRNFVAILMLSQGVPMLLAGDEFRRTQRGNNNAYCQDNATSWFDWTLLKTHADLLRFFKKMVPFRASHPSLRRGRYLTGQPDKHGMKDVEWYGTALKSLAWDDPNGRALAFTLRVQGLDQDLHVMLNMHVEEQRFALPAPPGGTTWHVAVDTAQPPAAGHPRCRSGNSARGGDPSYAVAAHGVVVLLAR